MLTEEFQAEIEAATTAASETAKKNAEGSAPASGDSLIGAGAGETKKDDGNGSGVGDIKKDSGLDPDSGKGGSPDPKSEGGSQKTGGGGDGDKSAPDGGHKGVSPATIMRAITAGISAADALALGDDGLVDSLIADKQSKERAKAEEAELSALRAEETKTIEQKQKALLDKLPVLDPDETDPAILASYEAMKSIILEQQNQLESLRVSHESQLSAADVAREKELTTWFEGRVTKLTEEFGKVLSKDGSNPVKITTERGDAIASKVAIMVEGYRASGIKMPSLDSMFDEAARIVLKDDFARMDEVQLTERMEKRSNQEISRPGGSKGKTEKSPVDEVADMLNKRYFADRS